MDVSYPTTDRYATEATRGNLTGVLKLPLISKLYPSSICLHFTFKTQIIILQFWFCNTNKQKLKTFPIFAIEPNSELWSNTKPNSFKIFLSQSQILRSSTFPFRSASIPSILPFSAPRWRLRRIGSALLWSFPIRICRSLNLCFPGCSLILLGSFTTSCAAVSVPGSLNRRRVSSLLSEILAMLLRKPFLLLGCPSLSFDLLGNVEMDSPCLSYARFMHSLELMRTRLRRYCWLYVCSFEVWMFCLSGECDCELDYLLYFWTMLPEVGICSWFWRPNTISIFFPFYSLFLFTIQFLRKWNGKEL